MKKIEIELSVTCKTEYEVEIMADVWAEVDRDEELLEYVFHYYPACEEPEESLESASLSALASEYYAEVRHQLENRVRQELKKMGF